jgi:DNA polymerase (family 10)
MKLYKELGITSLVALEEAARADRFKGVKGLGPAPQAKILQGIAIGRQAEGRRHMHRAAALLESAEQRLRQSHPDLKRITPGGEFRRGCELVADLSLVVEVPRADVGTIRRAAICTSISPTQHITGSCCCVRPGRPRISSSSKR